MNKFTVFVLRGIPGSGKSTLAKQFMDSGLCKYHVETDKFFVVDGVYKFDPQLLGVNHGKAFKEFTMYIRNGDGNIVFSNININKEWYEHYVKYAKFHGFNVTELILNQSFLNVHGVPEEKVAQMKRNFEF